MTVEYRSERDCAVISLRGEIDHHSARKAMSEICALIEENNPGLLKLDMKNVNFMDSSGLVLILNANRKVIQGGGRMSLANVPNQAMKVLASAGMDRVVNIE